MGRYLVPTIDVGSALPRKVLLPNGDYLCRSSVRAWIPKEEEVLSLVRELVGIAKDHVEFA